jgi:hypothetical protein
MAMTRARKAAVLLIALCAVAGVAVLRNALRLRRLEKGFERVALGDTRVAVRKELGDPWKVVRCGEFIAGAVPACRQQYVYANPYAPILPEYWLVSFNAEGHVVGFVRVASP